MTKKHPILLQCHDKSLVWIFPLFSQYLLEVEVDLDTANLKGFSCCDDTESQTSGWRQVKFFSHDLILVSFTRGVSHLSRVFGIHVNLRPFLFICIPALSYQDLYSAAALSLLIQCQNNYYSFIWPCTDPPAEALSGLGLPSSLPSSGYISQDGDRNTNIARLVLYEATKTRSHFITE